ncbi:hypothetical protein [Streptomyces litchfieldiae]|uniref:Phage protein n=1 Tax=Streptomyces litchfieldiae TaxID=3075543 RepID=A0ABU2MZJ3_9ACTN|nr:hypothetical protein [Streptomyces sp. DSM 44938]MDT0345939.1 hypothetical protein [Streptomyces sp. DSM 44938]
MPTKPLTWGPNRLPVPYAAVWNTETPVVARALTIRADGMGLAYRDETPADRDRHGVLWARLRHSPGEGRPNFRALHPHRQRDTMLHKLCHVCGGPASRTPQGWLFLLQRPTSTDQSPHWPEGLFSTKPPICEPCAILAARHCPHLTNPTAIRSRKPRTWGVFGAFYTPTPTGGFASSPTNHHLPYGHPASPWFVAYQLVIELTRCTHAGADVLRIPAGSVAEGEVVPAPAAQPPAR